MIDEFPRPLPAREIRLRSGRLTQVLGVSLDPEFVEEVLGRLGFELEPQDDDSWRVRVPSFRADVGLEDDLVEEVAREYGYDRLPTTYPAAAAAGKFSESEGHKRRVSSSLESCGFYEAMNYAFTNPGREEIFLGRRAPLVPIAQPPFRGSYASAKHAPSRVGGIDSAQSEFRQPERPSVRDRESLLPERRGSRASGGGAVSGAGGNRVGPWSILERCFGALGFHHLKGTLQLLLRKFGFEVEYRAVAGLPFLHPGISAEILREERRLGVLETSSPAPCSLQVLTRRSGGGTPVGRALRPGPRGSGV